MKDDVESGFGQTVVNFKAMAQECSVTLVQSTVPRHKPEPRLDLGKNTGMVLDVCTCKSIYYIATCENQTYLDLD